MASVSLPNCFSSFRILSKFDDPTLPPVIDPLGNKTRVSKKVLEDKLLAEKSTSLEFGIETTPFKGPWPNPYILLSGTSS